MNSMADRLASIARAAGEAIMAVYAREIVVEEKADGSPLTEADTQSHRILTQQLSDAFGLPIVSEEQPVEYDVRRDWPEFWLIDPLDGTKDFVARNDEFTLNIALVRHGEAVVGVVYAPASNELYYGERGLGAFQYLDDAWQRLPLHGHCIERRIAVSRFHDTPATAAFAALNHVVASQAVGSALKFGRLARGDVSLYPRFNGSCEWDIAAGQALIEAAGCHIIDLETGQPPRYNKPSFRNAYFVACAPTVPFSELNLPA